MTAEQLDEIRKLRERIAQIEQARSNDTMNDFLRGRQSEPDRKEQLIAAAKRAGFRDPDGVWDALWQRAGDVDELVDNLAAEKSHLLTGSAVMDRRLRGRAVSDDVQT